MIAATLESLIKLFIGIICQVKFKGAFNYFLTEGRVTVIPLFYFLTL